MVGEIFGGISAVKAAFDIAKGLKDIHDAALRNEAIINLQEQTSPLNNLKPRYWRK
jgi:hypothetical protein